MRFCGFAGFCRFSMGEEAAGGPGVRKVAGNQPFENFLDKNNQDCMFREVLAILWLFA